MKDIGVGGSDSLPDTPQSHLCDHDRSYGQYATPSKTRQPLPPVDQFAEFFTTKKQPDDQKEIPVSTWRPKTIKNEGFKP